ncbi:4'-phosphopantetheinyl transferase superfamily protein [Streptomyces sp. AC550_RSS872]|uniref:4'-phosphopantetheinyl transferase family protein n=1 Tax=Streptomyces sp. AC550_RSS872 TaxID=2823689 RepID=UPI001C269969|nr:4'-phosphopantetheinyl transferase superfamily protein [Streptomyces sp. AC550_RSS872]
MTAGAAEPGDRSPARVRVPAMRPGECRLWWASARDAHPGLRELLDEGERACADRLRKPAARALHLTAHALARSVAAAHLGVSARELVLTVVCKQYGGPHGKPEPPRPLRLAPYEPETAQRVLTTPERSALAGLPPARRPTGFVRYRTRKEALLKSTGDGLAVAPELLHVTAPDAAPRLLSWSGPARPRLPRHLYDGSTLLPALREATGVPAPPVPSTPLLAERPLAS